MTSCYSRILGVPVCSQNLIKTDRNVINVLAEGTGSCEGSRFQRYSPKLKKKATRFEESRSASAHSRCD